MDFSEKPDAQLVADVVAYYEKEVWGGIRTHWRKLDSYMQRRFAIWDDAHSDRLHFYPAKPAAIVNSAADTQMTFVPSVHRDPLSDEAGDKRAANRIEEALLAVLEDSAAHETVHPWEMGNQTI